MSITSLAFVLFALVTVTVYYCVPKRYQWIVLLAANAVFYFEAGLAAALCVLFTATSIYAATIVMQRITSNRKKYIETAGDSLSKEDKKALNKLSRKKRKAVMIAALLLNIGILCVVKYTHFVLAQFDALSLLFGGSGVKDNLNIIVPLGISFYTFQSVGYLLDVYWEKVAPQRNYLKFLLFVSFFAQMTQGPISDYESLSTQLYSEHKFSYENYSCGIRRMMWGFAKKLIIASLFGSYTDTLFANYESYTGITVMLGAFCYSVEIYADFSGYMDIMCGMCQVLGIRLKENFLRPYFSKSIAEYWRRWHISLGDWFKNYIYYPIGMSDWSRKIAKNTRKKFGAHFSNTLPATIALLIVWTATGLWHGASWGYIVWGLLNGVFIIVSMWLAPVYSAIKSKLKISDNSRWFRYFQVLRTFFLVTLIKVLPEVGGLRAGLGLWKQIFTDHRIPHTFKELFAFVTVDNKWFAISLLGVAAMLTVSLIERKHNVGRLIYKLPYAVKIAVTAVGLLIVMVIGGWAFCDFGGGGFLYAGF